jgi:hypothetical protein
MSKTQPTLTITVPGRFLMAEAPKGAKVVKPGTRQSTVEFTSAQLIEFMAKAAHFANHKNFSPVPADLWPVIDSARNTVKALDANAAVAEFLGIQGPVVPRTAPAPEVIEVPESITIVVETPDPAPEVGDIDPVAVKRAARNAAARERRAAKKAKANA